MDLCSKCNSTLIEDANSSDWSWCRVCQPNHRVGVERIDESLAVADQEGTRHKGFTPGLSRTKGIRFLDIDEPSFSVARQRWMRLQRRLDYKNDHYKEVVSDPESGEIIHYCDEPLSQHQGRGGAKLKSSE